MPIEFEYEEKIDIDLILHEPGTAPDIHGRTNTFIKIKPGKHYNIDTDATLTDVTESFKKMDLTKHIRDVHKIRFKICKAGRTV